MKIQNPAFVLDRLLADMEAITVSPIHSDDKKFLAKTILEHAQRWDEDESRLRRAPEMKGAR